MKYYLQLLATGVLSIGCFTSAIETVDDLVVSKYLGRWYQAYGNAFTARTITRDTTCVAADYGLDEATGNITVINSARELTPTGSLTTIKGYAYGTDTSKPGQLKVHLGQVPVDGDYWVIGLGPATFGPDAAYEWAIVSGPEAESLFILVRDVPEFEELYADGVLALVESLDFTGPTKRPQRIVQEGCLPFDPTSKAEVKKKAGWAEVLSTMEWNEETEAAYAFDRGLLDQPQPPKKLGWADFLSSVELQKEMEAEYDSDEDHSGVDEWTERGVQRDVPKSGVVPVTALDVNRYVGRWYQAYSSLTVSTLLEQKGACVTADYAKQEDGSISVVNTARAKTVDGELIAMDGYAYLTDETKPGELMVHLEGVPVDAPYWVVALGDQKGSDPYPWSIVSDPWRAFLFVLVRNPKTFFGSQDETDLLGKCEELGFTSFWNTPKKTAQEGCEYPEGAANPSTEKDGDFELSSALKLRDGGKGLKGPLHASCKITINFPKDGCKEVTSALVAAAKSMAGFDSCNGGNKCGYTVSNVADGSVEFVHETSVKHYKDSLTFTLTDKENSCEAAAFSTSQTWYAILDNSVNYCNLHNLVDASGLEYAETNVSDATCTQYSSADCERY